ncbi:MAG: hypothetical protein J7599_19195 [Niabella sp.]|nr:hypothetical protein [Niabella sp.]
MWRKLFGIPLMIIGGMVFLFFLYNLQNIHIPRAGLYATAGAIIFIAGTLLIDPHPYFKYRRQKAAARKALNNLLINGEKITVDLRECVITAHKYYETFETGTNRSRALDAAIGEAHRNIRSVEIRQSIFSFSYFNPRLNQTEIFKSPVIYKDNITLEFLLHHQQTTCLYVSKSDRSLYYFDLDFLEN